MANLTPPIKRAGFIEFDRKTFDEPPEDGTEWRCACKRDLFGIFKGGVLHVKYRERDAWIPEGIVRMRWMCWPRAWKPIVKRPCFMPLASCRALEIRPVRWSHRWKKPGPGVRGRMGNIRTTTMQRSSTGPWKTRWRIVHSRWMNPSKRGRVNAG